MLVFSSPVHIHWEFTNKCNLHCLHCYQQDDNIKGSILSFDALMIIAKKIIKSKIMKVTLTGGEPFIYEHELKKLILFFNSYGIIPNISSNGMMINENTIKWLKNVKINLQISLDSYLEEKHNYIRNSQIAYKNTLNTIELLHENNINFHLATCANEYNYNDLEGLINFAIDKNIKKIQIGEIMPFYGNSLVNNKIKFSLAEYKNFINSIINLKEEYSHKIIIEFISEWGFLVSDEIHHSTCSAFHRDMAILYDGSVTPCPFIRHKNYRFGNLLDQDVDIIWNSDRVNQFRIEKFIGCESSQCHYFDLCKSGCKAGLANQGKPINSRPVRCIEIKDYYE